MAETRNLTDVIQGLQTAMADIAAQVAAAGKYFQSLETKHDHLEGTLQSFVQDSTSKHEAVSSLPSSSAPVAATESGPRAAVLGDSPIHNTYHFIADSKVELQKKVEKVTTKQKEDDQEVKEVDKKAEEESLDDKQSVGENVIQSSCWRDLRNYFYLSRKLEEDRPEDRVYEEELQARSWNHIETGSVDRNFHSSPLIQSPVKIPPPVRVLPVKPLKPPKPMAKDPNKEEEQVVQIIKKRNGHLKQDGDEIELDIEAVDTETLWELDRLVTNWKKMVSEIKRQTLMSSNTKASVTKAYRALPETERIEVASVAKKPRKEEAGEEDVDIGDEMPMSSLPTVKIIEKDAGGHASSSSSSPAALIHNVQDREALQNLHEHLSILRMEQDIGKFILDPTRQQVESVNFRSHNILAVRSIAQAIILASGSYSGKHPEAVIVAVVQKSLEFALCFLEKSEHKRDDFGIQNNMLQLLEIALVNGTNKLHDSLPSCSEDSFSDLQAIVGGNSTTIEYDNYIMCGHQGASCSGEGKQVDRLLMSLTAECMQPDQQFYGFRDRPFINELHKLVSLSQHWVVAHLVGIQRLVMLCTELVGLPDNLEEKTSNANFCMRLTLGWRILKILKDLCRKISYVEYDASFVVAIASLADLLPSLFGIGFEFANGSPADGSFDSIIMLLLEEYLGLVQVVFCNSYGYQNIQACILASIRENLSSSIWRYRELLA